MMSDEMKAKCAEVAQIMANGGAKIKEACAKVGVSDGTFYKWRRSQLSEGPSYQRLDSQVPVTAAPPAGAPAAEKFMVLIVDKNQLMQLIRG